MQYLRQIYPTVNSQHLARNIARARTGQEHRRVRDLARRAFALDVRVGHELVEDWRAGHTHLGLDRAGSQDVDRDGLGPEFLRHRHCHGVECALRGRVDCQPLVAEFCGDGADVDDAGGGGHVRERGLDEGEWGADVDVVDVVPGGEGDGGDAVVDDGCAGVVDDDVDGGGGEFLERC